MPIFRPYLAAANVTEGVLEVLYDNLGKEDSPGIVAYNEFAESVKKPGEQSFILPPFKTYYTAPPEFLLGNSGSDPFALGNVPAVSVVCNQFAVEEFESRFDDRVSLHNVIVTVYMKQNYARGRYCAGSVRQLEGRDSCLLYTSPSPRD